MKTKNINKKLLIILLLISFSFFNCIFAKEIEIGFQGGYYFPSISIEESGDELLGKGSGKELKDFIGIKEVGNNIWFGGNINFLLHKNFNFQSEINYWSKTERTNATYLPEIRINTKFTDISIEGNFFLKKSISFIGGGLSLHHLKINVEPQGFSEVSEEGSKNKLGIQAIGGLKFSIKSKYSIIIALRKDFVSLWKNIRIYSGFLFRL